MSKTFEQIAVDFHTLVVEFCEKNPEVCIASSVITAERNATVMNLSGPVMNEDNFCVHRAIVEMAGDLCKAMVNAGAVEDRDMNFGAGETRQ